MKSKTLVIFAGLATLGLGAFLIFKNKSQIIASVQGPIQSASNGLSGQPGIRSASQYNNSSQNSVRADNANQPWYGGSTGFLGTAADYTKDISTISSSVSDLWDTLGFDSSDDSSDLSFDDYSNDNVADASGDFDFAYDDATTYDSSDVWSDYGAMA